MSYKPNYNLVVFILLLILCIPAVWTLCGVDTIQEELSRVKQDKLTEKLETLEDCEKQIEEAELRQIKLYRDRWLCVSDIFAAVDYKSYLDGYFIEEKALKQLIEEKSVESPPSNIFGASDPTDHTSFAITVKLNSDDLIGALRRIGPNLPADSINPVKDDWFIIEGVDYSNE